MQTYSRRQFLRTTASAASIAAAPSLLVPAGAAAATRNTVITAGTRVIEVNGRPATVLGLTQQNGRHGIVLNADDRFGVRLENQLVEETVVHWHGLTPPWGQDGVGGISQDPISPGGSYDYDFTVSLPGTNWMHSHFGLQEQRLLSAPLIVRDPAAEQGDVQDIVVLFHDFTFRDPEEILSELRYGGHGMMSGMGQDSGSQMNHGSMNDADEVAEGSHGAHGMPPAEMSSMVHLQDVEYDALLANDRTLDDPEIFSVEKGGRVRLRLINGAASTNMWIDLDRLQGQLIAVDGMPVQPIEGSRFEFAVAQRLDILLEVPGEGGALPIFAVQEGNRRRTGLILSTSGSAISRFEAAAAEDFPAVGADLERRLRTASPFTVRPADRQHTMMLGEKPGYVWTLGGQVHGEDTPLQISNGERFELTFMNHSTMSHPMHLHGHHFQVVAVNGERIQGAMRDTVLVPANMGSITIAFDGDNPGKWPLHCHHLYHMAGGMMTSVEYV